MASVAALHRIGHGLRGDGNRWEISWQHRLQGVRLGHEVTKRQREEKKSWWWGAMMRCCCCCCCCCGSPYICSWLLGMNFECQFTMTHRLIQPSQPLTGNRLTGRIQVATCANLPTGARSKLPPLDHLSTSHDSALPTRPPTVCCVENKKVHEV